MYPYSISFTEICYKQQCGCDRRECAEATETHEDNHSLIAGRLTVRAQQLIVRVPKRLICKKNSQNSQCFLMTKSCDKFGILLVFIIGAVLVCGPSLTLNRYLN